MSDLLCCDENLDRKSPDLWPEKSEYAFSGFVFVWIVLISMFWTVRFFSLVRSPNRPSSTNIENHPKITRNSPEIQLTSTRPERVRFEHARTAGEQQRGARMVDRSWSGGRRSAVEFGPALIGTDSGEGERALQFGFRARHRRGQGDDQRQISGGSRTKIIRTKWIGRFLAGNCEFDCFESAVLSQPCVSRFLWYRKRIKRAKPKKKEQNV